MKVSDPIMFGHAVNTYFADVFAKHGDAFAPHRRRTRTTGWPTCSPRSPSCPPTRRDAIESGHRPPTFESGPDLAMVDSDRGITNLHVPSDIIIDASMPAMIRTPGRCGTRAGELQDTKAVIPDSSLRRAVRGDDRRLPRARRVRPGDDGLDAERRAHGAEGRGVRLARQDVRDPRRRHRARRGRRRHRAAGARGRGRRHLARLPDEGRADPRLGAAWPSRARRPPARPPCSGSTRPAPTTPS